VTLFPAFAISRSRLSSSGSQVRLAFFLRCITSSRSDTTDSRNSLRGSKYERRRSVPGCDEGAHSFDA
jgi:hypothetical protein